MTLHSNIHYPRSATTTPLSPREVAKAYNFPLDKTGAGYVGGIIELGGGFDDRVAQYFAANGLPTPVFTSVPVAGGANVPDGPHGTDGEVQLDMIVAGAGAPGATFRVYFAPNARDGFLIALTRAASECHGVSVSWGSAENSWPTSVASQFENVIAAARARGVPVFIAAGDTGSQDSSGVGNQVDFPASAPSAVSCGGTRLTINADGSRADETVWNDDPTRSATGGGVSQFFPGRQVPDVAGNADPYTGYEVMVDGELRAVGGTSAVAPLMLGLHALLWESNGGKSFDFMNLVTAHPDCCFDVTVGDNGGFRAGPGRDDVTGFGVPDGARMAAALASGIPAPPAPTPVPTPVPVPDPVPTPSGFCANLRRIRARFSKK